jgi:WD40 repeat protein
MSRADVAQIWSLRFSADQRELVAGASSGQIMVYDIEARQRILNVYGHDDDGELVVMLESRADSRSQWRLLRRRELDECAC